MDQIVQELPRRNNNIWMSIVGVVPGIGGGPGNTLQSPLVTESPSSKETPLPTESPLPTETPLLTESPTVSPVTY